MVLEDRGGLMAVVAVAVLSACGGRTPGQVGPDGGARDASPEAADSGADDSGPGDSGVDAGASADAGQSLDAALPALAVQYGGGNSDEFLDVLAAGDLVYVAGYRNSALPWEPEGDSAGVVRAYATNGDVVWERLYDVELATEVADALALDGETLLVAGRTTGAYPGFTNAGKSDLVLSRLDRKGAAVTPTHQAGDDRPQHPNRIAVDGRGDVVVSGLNDVFIPTNYVEAWEDSLLARFGVDRVGNAFSLQSMTRSDSTVSDRLLGLAAYGADGDVIVTGSVSAGPERGPFAQRRTASGAVVWTQRFTDSGYDAASAVVAGGDGLVVVAGSTFAQLGARSYGQQDAFVAVLDGATGALLRAFQAGTSDTDWVRDLAVDAEGNFWLAGGTYGALPGFTSQGDNDAFLIRFDASGAWTGSWQHGTPGYDDANAVALDAAGNAYVVGNTQGNFVAGETYGGALDGFLLRVRPDQLAAPSDAR
ncbi:MAG: SBBP repeat-containing protein [Myxococcales bacterium]